MEVERISEIRKKKYSEISITALRELCVHYDEEVGRYPEDQYEGMSVFKFFMENTIKKYYNKNDWDELNDELDLPLLTEEFVSVEMRRDHDPEYQAWLKHMRQQK